MDQGYFWLNDVQFERLEAHLPTDTRGRPRVDDRRVISGIVHVLLSWLSLERRASGLWSAQDAVQPVPTLGREGRVVEAVSCLGNR